MKSEMIVTQEEKLLAALAHGSVIIPTWGIVVAAVVWLSQRGKSGFVEREARQATVWQVVMVSITTVAGFAAAFFAVVVALVQTASGAPQGDPPMFVYCFFPLIGLMFLGMLVFLALGVYGAVQTLRGRPYVYPLVGARVERYVARVG